MALNHHWCVGVDLHKDTLTACVFCGCCGEVSFQKIACRCRRQIAEYFAALPRPHTVAIESVGFYRWLWEMLEPIVEKLVLADATQARALAGRRLKTDREDALQHRASCLAAGRLPTSYAPPMEVQMLRDLTRHRNGFSRQHARILHRVKSIMNANNRPGPARMQSDGLIRYLKAQGEKLPARHVEMLWQCVDAPGAHRAADRPGGTRRSVELVRRDSFHEVYGILTSFPGVAHGHGRHGDRRDRRLQAIHRTPRRSAATPDSIRASTPREASSGSVTSPRPARPICGGSCSRRPGPPSATTST